ncbi:DNA-directed RNA polymerase III subunit [Klebsormidium nitens]|uniref:DNA-directed RNA polymerase III subunit n=1 Tax=Klebsormidium nitens TaxID=105231 RepID=A0A1Y1IMR5_KLENI|nr:DNA-directed RNA polymerase III subunit [Klebsormidium nitens]|eukprot:GAQ91943.1 DNA-directed RNA polymerase III subunit [Klebsormidium nitens]
MFVLASCQENIRIVPQDLHKEQLQAITDEIEKTYFDKVIPEVGLVITLYDISSIEGGEVYAGDGAPRFSVSFRLVVFRPFVGEVLVGKLLDSDASGLKVSLGFFDDIHVPEHLLQEPSVFDDTEGLWVWKYNDNDMFMDKEEEVRFKVSSVKFPPLPPENDGTVKVFSPMEITGDINADGLGLVSWWS